MKTLTKALSKTGVATAVAGAMAVSSASPAAARDHRDGIDAGDVIAGALIIGGIAAVAAAVDGDRNRNYRDRRYRNNHRAYRRGGPRRAVERCIRAAERDARRSGYSYADVTQVRDVERTRYGWRVKGRIEVNGARGYRGGYGYRNQRGYRGDYQRAGYGRYNRGYDRGKFTCRIEGGRVNYVNFKNIRGL